MRGPQTRCSQYMSLRPRCLSCGQNLSIRANGSLCCRGSLYRVRKATFLHLQTFKLTWSLLCPATCCLRLPPELSREYQLHLRKLELRLKTLSLLMTLCQTVSQRITIPSRLHRGSQQWSHHRRTTISRRMMIQRGLHHGSHQWAQCLLAPAFFK